MTEINSQEDGNKQPVLSMSTVEHVSKEEKQQLDTDGDGQKPVQKSKKSTGSKKEHKVEDLKNQFSHRTLQKMDHDGDGKITEGELNAYIRRIKLKAGRYRLYFIISLILFFLVMFGIFSLGFEVTRQFSINTNKTSPQGTRKLTDRDGNEVSTTTGILPVHVHDFWDEDVDDEDKSVTIHRGVYNGTIVNIEISRIEIIDNITTLYDYTGNVWFEYYRNGYSSETDSGTIEGYWIMYNRSVPDGEINIIRNQDTVRRLVETPSVDRRRLSIINPTAPTPGTTRG